LVKLFFGPTVCGNSEICYSSRGLQLMSLERWKWWDVKPQTYSYKNYTAAGSVCMVSL